jgi:hypothetical protein
LIKAHTYGRELDTLLTYLFLICIFCMNDAYEKLQNQLFEHLGQCVTMSDDFIWNYNLVTQRINDWNKFFVSIK